MTDKTELTNYAIDCIKKQAKIDTNTSVYPKTAVQSREGVVRNTYEKDRLAKLTTDSVLRSGAWE